MNAKMFEHRSIIDMEINSKLQQLADRNGLIFLIGSLWFVCPAASNVRLSRRTTSSYTLIEHIGPTKGESDLVECW